MNCKICNKQLSKNNTIGYCRAHRSKSPALKAYQKAFRTANPNISDEAKKTWRKNNPSYWSERLKRDPQAKLAHTVRTRINRSIKKKPGSAIAALGCTVQELKNYLESKFSPGMTWENHGKDGWEIDHIFPLSKVDLTNKAEFEKVCHYTNLQPLWKADNVRKNNRI